MWKKNSWNKKYEIKNRKYKVRDKDGKIMRDQNGKQVLNSKKECVLVAGGLKASPKEVAFRKLIKKTKIEKPKFIRGDWAWD